MSFSLLARFRPRCSMLSTKALYSAWPVLASYEEDGLGPYDALNDWLGTKRVQLAANGAVESTWANLPYGNQQQCVLCNNDGANRLHFTGKERDTESGLDYFSARYYSSSGRFMSPDPITMNTLRLVNPQRWNKYSYVINNPLVLTDLSGKDAVYVNFNKMAMGDGHIDPKSNGGSGTLENGEVVCPGYHADLPPNGPTPAPAPTPAPTPEPTPQPTPVPQLK